MIALREGESADVSAARRGRCAQAGGWASLEALKQAYQRSDDETLLRVVTSEVELREAR